MKITPYIAVFGLLYNAVAITPEEMSDLKQRAAKMDTAALHELINLSAEADSGISGKELVRYCTLAAGQDDVEAQVFLYTCYATGKHVTADREIAQMWKDSVLATGNADALFKLGRAMMETGLPSERAEGKRHCELAATKGCEEAKKWKAEREAAEKAEEELLAAEAKAEEERMAAAAQTAEVRRSTVRSEQEVRELVKCYLRVGETLSLPDMYSLYEPTVRNLADGSTMTLEQHLQECRDYANRWPVRRYDIIEVAHNGRFIEVQMRYTCTNAQGKTVRGYSKATLLLSSGGKIEGVGDDSSTKSIPPFSHGMNRILWY